MKQYWPMAKCIDNGKEIDMFSYGCVTSVEKALKSINTWNEIYWVKEAWIDVMDTDVPEHKEKIEVRWSSVTNKEDLK